MSTTLLEDRGSEQIPLTARESLHRSIPSSIRQADLLLGSWLTGEQLARAIAQPMVAKR